jgi:hypothetical protein
LVSKEYCFWKQFLIKSFLDNIKVKFQSKHLFQKLCKSNYFSLLLSLPNLSQFG